MLGSRKLATHRGWRLGLVAGACALVVLTTASAVLASSSARSSSKTTTLTLWQYGKLADSASYMTKIIANFEAANPSVKIKVVEQPGQTYFAQLHTAMISKTAPDIADLFAGSYLSQLIPYLTNLNSGVGVSLLKSAKGANFYAKGSNIANGTYGVPAADQFYNAFYNKSLFTKAGISAVPTNWTQLFADCTKLKAKGILPFAYGAQGGGAEMGTHEDLSYLASALPLKQWNGLYNGTVKYNSPAMVSQVEQWQKIYSDKCTNTDALTNQTPLEAFAKGKAAMIVGGSWLIQTFAPLGKNLGSMIPPFSAKPQHTIVELPGGGYGVPSSSKNVKLAEQFLAFLLTKQSQEIVAQSGQPPVVTAGVKVTNKAVVQLLNLAHSGKFQQYPMFDNFTASSVTDALDKELGPAFVGQKSATAALSDLDKTTQSLPKDQKNVNYGFGS
jgi:ABC-type glycerol-3-phosphate transport system substrate-binding protein